MERLRTDSARKAIRKAQREDVEVRPAESENDLRAFFEMHRGLRNTSIVFWHNPIVSFRQSGITSFGKAMARCCSLTTVRRS